MNIYYIISLVFIISSALLFIVYIKNNKKRKIALNEKELDIEKTTKETKSSNNSFDTRYASESELIRTNIKDSQLNIISLNKSIEKEKEANYMKNVFLTNISNEIRNPLNGIMGFANLLRTDLAKLGRDDLYEFANNISKSGEGLLKLLSDIIDISRIEVNDVKFNIRNCDLKSIILQTVDLYEKTAKDKGLQVIIDDKLNYFALSDTEVIQRIINSVIENAIKFTDKGFIKLSVSADKDKGLVTISIKDTGIGIDPSYIPAVFEPYRQESLGYNTKYKGAGLSLPLAKKALNTMDSDIQIESEKGVGTTVDIILKLSTKKDSESSANLVADENNSADWQIPWYKKNIFLVEDDKINQILFSKLLTGCNNLIIADSGEDALEKLTDLTDNKFNIDFVLMDINLPGQYNGIKLMHKIKQKWVAFTKIPFIAQTAYAMSNEREKLLAEGFDEYLSKPIKKVELMNVVEKVL